MKILIAIGGYYPAKNYGGPVISIKNLVDLIGNDIECYIVTRDVEFGTNDKLPGIKKGWNSVFNANVMYLGDEVFNYNSFVSIVKEIKPNVIYLNSFFSYKMLLPFLKISKQNKIPILIATRGELCNNALRFKKLKKIFYIFFIKNLVGLSNCYFQSTSEEEMNNIHKLLHIDSTKIYNLPNIPTHYNKKILKKEKKPGNLKIVFISRIHPKKNLLFAVQCLGKIKGNVKFDIYGPLEDHLYWNKISDEIKKLPYNISVSYCGVLDHDEIVETMSKYDCFLFYTLSENYGHVIAEAVTSLCPPIISDQTPWNDLKKYNAGEVSDLKKLDECILNIQKFVDMNNLEYSKIIDNLKEYGKKKIKNEECAANYKKMLKHIARGVK